MANDEIMVLNIGDGVKITLTKVGTTTKIESNMSQPEDPKNLKSAFDLLESAILAHAHSGINVAEEKYVKGIQTAYEKAIEMFYG